MQMEEELKSKINETIKQNRSKDEEMFSIQKKQKDM